MIRLLFLLTLIVLFFSCSNQNENQLETEQEELVEPDYCDCNQLMHDPNYNNFYLNKPRKGYTGVCELFFQHKKTVVQQRKELKDGKLHGEMLTYYDSGKLRSIKYFENNLQVGNHLIYSEDNRLLFMAKYERGTEVERIVLQPMPPY